MFFLVSENPCLFLGECRFWLQWPVSPDCRGETGCIAHLLGVEFLPPGIHMVSGLNHLTFSDLVLGVCVKTPTWGRVVLNVWPGRKGQPLGSFPSFSLSYPCGIELKQCRLFSVLVSSCSTQIFWGFFLGGLYDFFRRTFSRFCSGGNCLEKAGRRRNSNGLECWVEFFNSFY